MKVLLIQPPHYYGGKSRSPDFFPLGLGYIAKSLINDGHRVEVLDIWAHQYSHDEVVRLVRGLGKYDVIGIGALSTQYKYVKWLTHLLKDRFKSSSSKGVKIILGGPLPTLSHEVVLRNMPVDACVIGEGEKTAVELVNNLNRMEEVEGVAFLENGSIVKTRERALIKNLDEIDFPAWEKFPIEIYLKKSSVLGWKEVNAINVVVGRGCPYRCRFCSRIFKTTRVRSVDNLIEEIKLLKKRYGVRGICFSDDLLVINKNYVYELCDAIEPLNLKWNCQGRVNHMDFEMLKRMKEAGCVTVGYGIESGSQTILDNMNKRIKVEDSERVLKETIKLGLHPLIQAMYGYPGENIITLKETVDFFKKIPYGQIIHLSITTPLPGTPLYEQSIEDRKIRDEDEYLSSLSAGYSSGAERPIINYTAFSDHEFLYWHEKSQEMMFKNQLLYHPLFIFKNKILVKLKRYMKKYGLNSTFRSALKKMIRLTKPLEEL